MPSYVLVIQNWSYIEQQAVSAALSIRTSGIIRWCRMLKGMRGIGTGV